MRLVLATLIALILASCSPAPAGTPVPQLTACESAVKIAADIDAASDTVTDLDLAIRACATLGDFMAAAAGYPAALDGADAREFVRNRCTLEASLAATTLCTEVGAGVGATATPDVGTGLITFGDSLNKSDLSINPTKNRFKLNDRKIAWSASLTGDADASVLTRIIASKTGSGVERVVYREKFDVADPGHSTFADVEYLGLLVGGKAGTYVMRILRGASVLAEGEFKLVR